jgi:hypothetical protein
LWPVRPGAVPALERARGKRCAGGAGGGIGGLQRDMIRSGWLAENRDRLADWAK